MKITFHGQSCFTIEHDKVKIVTDPFNPEYCGIDLPKLEADFVTISHEHKDHNYKKGVDGNPMFFDWPGEYEAKDIFFQGITAYHFSKEDGEEDRGEVTIFIIRFEDFSICHLSDLGHRIPSRLLDIIGDIDILFVPVGGKCTIDAKKAEEVINQIEPRVAIPMHYALPGLKFKLDPVEKFLKEMGAIETERKTCFEPKKSDLNTEATQIIVLKPQSQG